ncbi:MAG: TrbI/VirB10 family protein [Candidatus Obscuribacterales bacterium]
MEETFETRDRKRPLKVYLCAWGLVLSLSASTPLAVLSADTPTEGDESPVLRSTVIQTERERTQSPTVNTGDVRVVAPGTVLELALSTEIDADVTEEGDEFLGKIIKDVLVDGRLVIPRGTVVHGVLSTMEGPKSAGRNGYITTRFDYLITPDGREVPIEGNSSTRDSKGKAAAKVVGRAAGYTAVGGVVGTLMALRFGGLAAAAASYGCAPAGGAAIGGAAGLTIAMLMKGESVMLQPGAEMHVELSEPLKLPTMTMPDETADDYSIPGLNVKVAGMRIGRMSEITLKLDVLNETENAFSKFEIALEDELGNVFFPSSLGDTGMLSSKIKPNSQFNSKITFSVDNAKIRHKLVFFKPFSRDPLAKFALTDAMQAGGKARSRGKRVATEARQPD